MQKQVCAVYEKWKDEGIWHTINVTEGWEHALEIDGFMTFTELRWLYKSSLEMESIIEIGTWQGRSTYALCAGCRGEVYTVDYFKMHKQAQWLIDEGHARSNFDIFAYNMEKINNISLFIGTSKQASRSRKLPRKVDMVFIDGNHEYKYVLDDIKRWTPRARKMICGHDMDMEGVQKAVGEYFGKFEQPPGTNIWAIKLGG
jgi:precorrin-6B methylase 2